VFNKHSVLVVDDEADIRSALSSELVNHGYQVLSASDGKEAITTLAGKRIDVVLLDINMPKADGFEVLEFIKDKSPRSKVIMLSAFADLNNVFKSKQLEAKDFIPKPYSLDDVLTAIKRALND
jgi:two-component system response regulator AtoC